MSDPKEPPAAGTLGRRILVGLFLGLVVYALLVLWADIDGIRAALAGFDPWLIPAAMALSFANYVVRFPRWERYRALVGARMPRGTSFVIYLAGLSLTVTPGKMGEAFKSWLVRRVAGTPVHVTAPIVVAERFTDLLGFLVLVAVGGLATVPEHAWIFWSTLALCGVLLVLFASRHVSEMACAALERAPLARALAPKARGAFASTRVLLAPRELPLATLLATLGWSLECVGAWWIAGALVPGGVPFLFVTYAFALSAIAGAVLILFPGGLGVTEGTLASLLSMRYRALGVAADAARAKAVSATLLIRLCTLWFAMGVGLVALAIFQRRHRGSPTAARPAAQEAP